MCLRFVPRSITVYLVLALSLTTHAQPKFVPLAIDSKPGSPPPQPCVDAHAIIRPLVSKYPHPDTWTWIIACDERSWSALVKHLGWSTAPWGYTMALTDQTAHITYVRADAILHPKLGPDSEPEHIIAHELCHIYLHSADEGKVDDLAWEWQKHSKSTTILAHSTR